MGRQPWVFKKIRVIKGIFQAKVCTVKDRSGKDLIEAEEIKKRWKEYTKELYKRDPHDPDNHDGVIIDMGWLQGRLGPQATLTDVSHL